MGSGFFPISRSDMVLPFAALEFQGHVGQLAALSPGHDQTNDVCLLKSRKECCLDEVAELSSSGYRVNVIQNFSPEIQGIMLSYSKQVRLVAGASIPWFRRDFFPCEDTPSS